MTEAQSAKDNVVISDMVERVIGRKE
jgi:hypothetical protein